MTKNGEGGLVGMDIESFTRREKMPQIRENLLAVEEDRTMGRNGDTNPTSNPGGIATIENGYRYKLQFLTGYITLGSASCKAGAVASMGTTKAYVSA